MSKMFEALRKTESGVADVAIPVLEDRTPLTPEPAEPQDPITKESAVHRQDAPLPESEARAETIHIAPSSPMFPFDGADPRAAEQYRIIRTKIRHHPERPKLLLVSSPMPGDGKTTSAANLAAALSLQENLRVLLVDCDFRRSSLTRAIGLNPQPGLSDVLREEATLESTLVSVEQFPNLYFLPPGSAVLSPSEMLSTAKWQALVETFRCEFQFVVLDAPPVGMVADYELLQLACDGVVLVVRPDHTNRQLWRKALETVPKSKQIGVILNCAGDWFRWKSHSYYYYSGKAE